MRSSSHLVDSERRLVVDSYSSFVKQLDINKNVTLSSPSIGQRITQRLMSRRSLDTSYCVGDEVIKVAAYLKMLLLVSLPLPFPRYVVILYHCVIMFGYLQKIVESVKYSPKNLTFKSTVDMSLDTGYRSYEFNYTCAVDKTNVKRVLDGCKNIIIRDYLAKMGIPLD